MKTVTVMVVEDSAVARRLLVDTLDADPRIRVVAAVESGEAALRILPRLTPNVVSMDIRLPGMSGIEATRRIMEVSPTPVIVVASDLSRSTTASAMEAIRAGALLVLEKPSVENAETYRAMAKRLCDQFVSLSSLHLVRRRFGLSAATPVKPATFPAIGDPIDIVGIVASTGGPAAVAQVLSGLGGPAAVPILIVQHMGGPFLEGFADWLTTTTGRYVTLARDGEAADPGRIYVGPAGHHLTLRGGRLRLVPGEGDTGHVPSGNALLASLAADAGPRALGVLLTGMGDDGADGLLALRRAGGVTIGQDRATSAVYGMPAVAMALGAVGEELPLEAIAPRILQHIGQAGGERPLRRRAAQ